jgi:hypothetical protein
LNATQLQRLLKSLGACEEAVEFARGKSLAEAWEKCERADWMLWLLGKQIGKKGWPDRKMLVLLACLCAETSLKFIPTGEERPRKAIETARAWCEGKATLEEIRAAAAAADAAYAAYAAAAYAAYAAAAYAAYAAAAAAYAADAAAYAAGRTASLKKMAEMIRAAVPVPIAEAA